MRTERSSTERCTERGASTRRVAVDDGETDWKVLCINVEDPLSERLHDIDDLEEKVLDGVLPPSLVP